MNAAAVVRVERTPAQRLRHVRSTVAALPDLGLEIQALPDGRQAVVLPAGLVDFFVEDLAHRAAEWKEQARKARGCHWRSPARVGGDRGPLDG